jgi:hypothetical protein
MMQSIAARLEICARKARHLRLLDRKDWDGYAALLTEDFTLDVSAGTNIPIIRGRDAVVAQVRNQIDAARTVHQAHPPELELGGDAADVLWPIQDRIVRGPDQPSYGGYGHHHDRWVRRGGEWKLASQKLTRLHVDVHPPAAIYPGAAVSPAVESTSWEQNVNAISDWIALCEAKARYCRTLDTKDWAGYADLLTEDYVLDVTEGTQVPVIRGREAAIKQIQSSILTATTAHQVHSPEIEVNGDEARVVWALQDRVIWGPERPSITGYGHYHERWVRQNGQWKLASLKLTRLHMDVHPPTGK